MKSVNSLYSGLCTDIICGKVGERVAEFYKVRIFLHNVEVNPKHYAKYL